MAFYGDDFTGSTDVLEALSLGGMKTVLFVGQPSDALRARFHDARAVGLAGCTRGLSPSQMETELTPALTWLRGLGPAIVHYKTCSTFDSSPHMGSIGRAIDVGFEIFQNRLCPLVVGAPALQRFCVFGNLFARSGLDSRPYRLDRHPTMSRHPVTPMDEADLRVHLAKQTTREIQLVDVLDLARSDWNWQSASQEWNGSVVLFDTLTPQHLSVVGRTLAEHQEQERKPLFVAGSSGVNYALVQHWRDAGMLSAAYQWQTVGAPVEQTLVVSGSCSPVTERQIAWASDHQFAEIALPTDSPLPPESLVQEAIQDTCRALDAGRSVIVHTSRGPDDSRIARTDLSASALGELLALVLLQSLRQHPLARVVVMGGDTSGHVARRLNVQALEMVGPMAPGSPLCRVHSDDPHVDGLEIVFKGGQVGHDDFFASVLAGRPH